jgi:hypothetical protein
LGFRTEKKFSRKEEREPVEEKEGTWVSIGFYFSSLFIPLLSIVMDPKLNPCVLKAMLG